MSSPVPDPTAPICVRCQKHGKRKDIHETSRTLNAVQVAQGMFWDNEGRKHEHYGTPPGEAAYRCDCGYTWKGAFKATLYPCWCGWGRST